MGGERTSLLGKYLENEKFRFYLPDLIDILKLLDGIRELLLATKGPQKVKIFYPVDSAWDLELTLRRKLPPSSWTIYQKGCIIIRWYGVEFHLYPVPDDEWSVAGMPVEIKAL